MAVSRGLFWADSKERKYDNWGLEKGKVIYTKETVARPRSCLFVCLSVYARSIENENWKFHSEKTKSNGNKKDPHLSLDPITRNKNRERQPPTNEAFNNYVEIMGSIPNSSIPWSSTGLYSGTSNQWRMFFYTFWDPTLGHKRISKTNSTVLSKMVWNRQPIDHNHFQSEVRNNGLLHLVTRGSQ